MTSVDEQLAAALGALDVEYDELAELRGSAVRCVADLPRARERFVRYLGGIWHWRMDDGRDFGHVRAAIMDLVAALDDLEVAGGLPDERHVARARWIDAELARALE